LNQLKNSVKKTSIRLDVLFFSTGLLFLMSGIIAGKRTFDFVTNSTYFIIDLKTLGGCICIIYMVYSTVYFIFNAEQKQVLGLLHFAFVSPLFLYLFFSPFMIVDTTSRYSANSDFLSSNQSVMLLVILVMILLFIIGQLLFLINVIIAIIHFFRNKKGRFDRK
jgi:hypothetical protein